MKKLNPVLKWFLIAVVAVAIIIGDLALLMKFFGKNALEKALSKTFGLNIKFQGVSLNLDKGSLNFQGFTVLGDIEFEENIFNAEKFVISINKEKFDKDKIFAFEEVYIKKGTLNIERNISGLLNLNSAMKAEPPAAYGTAHADTLMRAAGNLYNTVGSIKKIIIEDSTINFKDSLISRPPFAITCNNFNLSFIAGQTPSSPSASIPATFTMSFRVPDQASQTGGVSLSANMSIYQHRTDAAGTLDSQYLNLMRFRPYFETYTPFYFSSGLFSSNTNFSLRSNTIDSSTIMSFRNLMLKIKPGQENAQFFTIAANKLLPYLRSQQGDVLFDFVIKGSLEKPAFGLGPKVKFAIGMVALEEFSKAMQQLQKFRQ